METEEKIKYTIECDLKYCMEMNPNLIDVAEGTWIVGDDYVYCSECDSVFEFDEHAEEYNFCPICGSRMGADDNQTLTKRQVLQRIAKKFRCKEEQTKYRLAGLKEWAVWEQAANEVESWIKRGANT